MGISEKPLEASSSLREQLRSQKELYEIEKERVGYLTNYFSTIVNSMLAAMIVTDEDLFITELNTEAERLFGSARSEMEGAPLVEWIDHPAISEVANAENLRALHGFQKEIMIKRENGDILPVFVSISELRYRGEEAEGVVCMIKDLSSQKKLEQRLLQAQKLESVGQLAAGIAHEINTPIQYVRDNMLFLSEEFQNVSQFILELQGILEQQPNCKGADLKAKIDEHSRLIELPYLLNEIPSAIEQTREGADAVAHIVKSLKEFSHPGGKEKVAVDINESIQSATTVSKNEWKYVAKLELNLDASLPSVECFPSEVNQVLLNIIVNAAHAIKEKNKNHPGQLGVISIGTSHDETTVHIHIQDDGVGIPKEIRDKVFDPFFTTKDVGEGSGQGLNFAFNTIVEKHGGALHFESVEGEGSTFFIELPRSH